MLFSGFLELPVVVASAPAGILNPVLKVPQVNHFMDQGATGFFKGPVQIFSAKVDFIEPAFLGTVLPRFPTGTPTIGPHGYDPGKR